GGSGESVKLKSVSTTTSGKTFSSWTSGDNHTDSGTLVTGSPTPCISNSSGGSNGNLTDAYAHFVNSTATLTVIKHVVNNNGGAATASQWSLHVKSGSSEVTGSPQNGTESGTTYTLNAGAYAVSETGGPSGYAASFSASCTAGNVTLAIGDAKTCT